MVINEGGLTMATSPTLPRLIAHHGYKSWTSTWRDDLGSRRTKRFGKESELAPRQARAAFDMWIDLEWKAHEHVRNPDGEAATYSIQRMADEYLAFATTTYVKHGRTTSHVWQVKYAMQALALRFGIRPAASLESPDLAALRDEMIHGSKTVSRKDDSGQLVDQVITYNRSMKTVNDRLVIIKEAFAWAREHGKVPRSVLLDLQTVSRLRAGRSAAKDSQPVLPIAWDVVEATMQHCTPTIRTMIELNYLMGARPGEICIMRGRDLDMTGDIWIYSPSEFKLEHLELPRRIAIGPKARKLIEPYLHPNMAAYLFSPAVSVLERQQLRSESRKTPIGHGNGPGTNIQEDPQWYPGAHYTAESFRRAIHRACKRAGIEPWNPNQLRHTHATEVRRLFGLEAASDALGHSNLSTTEIYAEKSLERAKEIARKVG